VLTFIQQGCVDVTVKTIMMLQKTLFQNQKSFISMIKNTVKQ